MEILFHTRRKEEMVLDIEPFEPLIKQAKVLLEKYGSFTIYTQAVVVQTSSQSLYGVLIENVMDESESFEHLLNNLKDMNDIEIQKIVCIWSDGRFDMPSYNFRKGMYDIHKNNKNAILLLSGDFLSNESDESEIFTLEWNGNFIKKTLGQTLNITNK